MNQKRLAIQFFGHTRTYKKTHESFFKYIVEPNQKDGWEIDIFIHTWDMSSSSDKSWHIKQDLFDINPLSQNDIENIKRIYNPKKMLVEHLQDGVRGGEISKERGNILRETYEKENNIKYDYILYTRLDILFASSLNIQRYIDLYTIGAMRGFPLPEKHCFVGFNPFVRSPVIDTRYVNEGDIVYFTNCSCDKWPSACPELFLIMIDYKLYRDFFLQRKNFILGKDLAIETKLKISQQNLAQKDLELKKSQDKLLELQLQLDAKTKENIEISSKFKSLEDSINSLPIKKQTLEIKNLEQDLINKELKAKILKKELSYNYNLIKENEAFKNRIKTLQSLVNRKNNFIETKIAAKSRIQNQLSYKLGLAMIENSKSLWGYIRMPYVLSYIKDQHQKEQKAYHENIKVNPNLKLPPLESYPDYNEALKYKEHLSYKLGQALIEADKSAFKLGYLTLWFKCKKIQKMHKS